MLGVRETNHRRKLRNVLAFLMHQKSMRNLIEQLRAEIGEFLMLEKSMRNLKERLRAEIGEFLMLEKSIENPSCLKLEVLLYF